MSLLKLKSIFSPTNTKFQDNQSDLTTFPRQFDNDFQQSNLLNLNSKFDDGLNLPILSNVMDFNSIYDDDLSVLTGGFKRDGQQYTTQFNFDTRFDDGIFSKFESYIQNQPQNKFDTKLNYNENNFINQTHTEFNVSMENRGGRTNPILDSLLRGRVYTPIQFSQDFQNNSLFVKPETGELIESMFRTQTFDPRAPFAKEGTLYFNINNSFNPATNPTDFSTAGNNKGPYTPLTELGGQFKEFLSWENLYNSNHSPKDNPSYKGKSPVGYGGIVNRDMLDINYNIGGDGGQSAPHYGEKTGIVGGFSRRGLSGNGEPYRVTDIGDRDNNRGSRFSPLRRALNDGDRILQYLTSAEGLAFILRQNSNALIENIVFRGKDDSLLRTQQRFGVTYNPLNTILASSLRVVGQGIPEVQFRRSFAKSEGLADAIQDYENLTVNEELSSLFRGESGYSSRTTNAGFSIDDTFTKAGGTGATAGGGFFSEIGKAISSLNPFDAGTTVPKTNTGDKITLAPMIKGAQLSEGGTRTIELFGEEVYSEERGYGAGQGGDIYEDASYTELGVNPEEEKNGMPFYFKDLRDSAYIFFRAYIEGLTENISPSYASHNYVGRSEPVYTYERAEREISFTLKLVAQTKGELIKIYEKMDRLTSLCYPQYVKNYGTQMKAPLTKLRYGELFGSMNKELTGYIKSISYAVDNSATYETDPTTGRVPKHINATIGYQVIHDTTPSKDTKFYGINHEKMTTRQDSIEEIESPTLPGENVNTDFGSFA